MPASIYSLLVNPFYPDDPNSAGPIPDRAHHLEPGKLLRRLTEMTDQQNDTSNAAAAGVTQQAGSGAAPAAKPPAAPAEKSNPAPGDVTHVDNLKDKPKVEDQVGQKHPAPAADGNHIDPKTGNVVPSAAKGQPGTAHVVQGISTDAGKIAQHDQIMQQQKARDKANEEGHAKNVAADEKAHAEGAEKAEKAGAPPTGKQRDVNTPIIDPVTGAKKWPL